MTPDLLLACVVDRVLVPGKIVRPGENRIAWLSRRRIDPLTFVGTGLRVACGSIAPNQVAARRSLTVGLALVLLQLRRRFKPKRAAVVSASVSATVRRSALRAGDLFLHWAHRHCGLCRWRSHTVVDPGITVRRLKVRKGCREFGGLVQEVVLLLLLMVLLLLREGILLGKSIRCSVLRGE